MRTRSPVPGPANHPAVQPGGRPAAPGALALVQSFINSHYDLELEHGADLFATPRSLARWLVRNGLVAASDLRVRRRDLQRARALREGLRALAVDNGELGAHQVPRGPAVLARLNELASGAAAEVRFGETGPYFVSPGGRVDGALGVVLSAAALAMVDGTWSRLKICPGDGCGWAFYDYSRNQSGRWCSMNVCGGRAKARAHYHRRRGVG